MTTLAPTIVAVVLALTSSAAHAQAEGAAPAPTLDEAREHFASGTAAADAGRWDEAAQHFRHSWDSSPRTTTGFNLAIALVRSARPADALDILDATADTVTAEGSADMEAIAAIRVRAEQDVVRLEVLLEPASAELRVDGGPVRFTSATNADARRTLLLNPGRHRLTATATGYEPLERDISGAAGERPAPLELRLTPVADPAVLGFDHGSGAPPVIPAPADAPGRDTSPTTDDSSAWESPWLWGGAALLVGAVVVGTVLLAASPDEPFRGNTGMTVPALLTFQ